jgi:hypothetical protein
MALDSRGSRRRMARFSVGAAIVAVSVAFSLVAGEGVLRLIGFSYPAFHVPDELAGIRLRPGAHGWYSEEGAAYVTINSDGWRDIERAKAKPPGVVRIALLGDSFMEAIQVAREDTFAARLEGELGSCRPFGKRPVEVLNFGVSSYGTAQELLTLRHRAREYAPDVVMLAFLPSNDVRNNSSTLEEWKARPFFELKGGELAVDNAFRDDPGFKRRKQRTEDTAFLLDLRLHQLLRKVRDGRYQGWNDAPTLAIGHAPALREPGIAERALVPPKDGAWDEAWKLTDRLIEAVHAEAQSFGARFVLVVLTTGGSVYPDESVRQRHAASLGVDDLYYPDRRLGRLGKEYGFEVVSLGPAMQRRADESGAFFHGFSNTRMGVGHWNSAGHRAAAAIVAEHFCAAPGGGRVAPLASRP